MALREEIIRRHKGLETEAAAIRCLDLVELVLRTRKYRASPFLDAQEQAVAKEIAASCEGISVSFDGGFAGARRKRAIFCHEEFAGEPSFSIAVVKVIWNFGKSRPSYRGVLDLLIGIGIERQFIGDILLSPGSARILSDEKTVRRICNSMVKFGGTKITAVERSNLADIVPRENYEKEMNVVVSSLRLDAVISAALGMSRTKSAMQIEEKNILVNWQPAKNAAQTVSAGDVISFGKRHDRIEVSGINWRTKKDRINLSLRYVRA